MQIRAADTMKVRVESQDLLLQPPGPVFGALVGQPHGYTTRVRGSRAEQGRPGRSAAMPEWSERGRTYGE